METVSTAVSEEALPSLQGKWVPLEPTEEMLEAADDDHGQDNWRHDQDARPISAQELARRIYRAMLAAAPQVDQVAQLQGGWILAKDAPEDQDLLCYWGDHVPLDVGVWNGRSWQASNGDMHEFDDAPTHCYPLPPPPLPAAGQEG